MPFGGYREKYEICSPAQRFYGFALATEKDYDYIKTKCQFFTVPKRYLVVVDPYDENYKIQPGKQNSPPLKTRRALRVYFNQFAPSDTYVENFDTSYVKTSLWGLNDFDRMKREFKNDKEKAAYGKLYDADKCLTGEHYCHNSRIKCYNC